MNHLYLYVHYILTDWISSLRVDDTAQRMIPGFSKNLSISEVERGEKEEIEYVQMISFAMIMLESNAGCIAPQICAFTHDQYIPIIRPTVFPLLWFKALELLFSFCQNPYSPPPNEESDGATNSPL